MAKYTSSISVTFNDNDGKVGWRCNPETSLDVHRHQVIFGKFRTRWILFKRFWKALMWMEDYVEKYHGKVKKKWIIKPEIPE